MKGFLNNCDDTLKWELELVQWIDTQELSTWAFALLSFILMQSSTNPETAETSISTFVLRIIHKASLYLQIVLQPWGEVSLPAQNSYCRVQQTETDYCLATDRDVLCIQGSLQTSGLCVFPRDSSHSVAIVFHWFYILEISFANLGACLCHFCSTQKGSMPHCRFLRHWKVPVRSISHFPE